MAGFCLRVKEEQERQLYVLRELYVGIRRDWARGTKVLFVKKTLSGDIFIGSGILGSVVELEQMGEDEKKRCLENNWYGKLVFLTIARFTVPVSETALAGQQPAFLHGIAADVGAAESLARGRLVT